MLPCYYLSPQIAIHLIYFVIICLTALKDGNGISQKYSQSEIGTGWHKEFKTHCKVVFGSYVEAHEYPNITNNMIPRNHKCITLGPTENLQGTHNLFCLNTGRALNRRNIISIIAPDRVIS